MIPALIDLCSVFPETSCQSATDSDLTYAVMILTNYFILNAWRPQEDVLKDQMHTHFFQTKGTQARVSNKFTCNKKKEKESDEKKRSRREIRNELEMCERSYCDILFKLVTNPSTFSWQGTR